MSSEEVAENNKFQEEEEKVDKTSMLDIDSKPGFKGIFSLKSKN